MLKRIFRLPITSRMLKAQTTATPIVILKTTRNGLSRNRFGFVISKKTAPLAVNRNRSKRKVRQCIEKMINTLPAGNDLLFILKKDLSNENQNDLCFSVNNLLQKRGLL